MLLLAKMALVFICFKWSTYFFNVICLAWTSSYHIWYEYHGNLIPSIIWMLQSIINMNFKVLVTSYNRLSILLSQPVSWRVDFLESTTFSGLHIGIKNCDCLISVPVLAKQNLYVRIPSCFVRIPLFPSNHSRNLLHARLRFSKRLKNSQIVFHCRPLWIIHPL